MFINSNAFCGFYCDRCGKMLHIPHSIKHRSYRSDEAMEYFKCNGWTREQNYYFCKECNENIPSDVKHMHYLLKRLANAEAETRMAKSAWNKLEEVFKATRTYKNKKGKWCKAIVFEESASLINSVYYLHKKIIEQNGRKV